MAPPRSPASQAYFTPGLFQFLRELKNHNSREWFEQNRSRYEADLKGPMLQFIGDLGFHLRRISPHFRVDPRPVGGSMFRIHRDIRFSRDKRPYKANVGAHFRHLRAGDVHAPGFYLHLEPGRSFGGGGLWHPDGATLKEIRSRIASRPRAWSALRDRGVEIQGDSLKRVPVGYDPAHPFAADLRLKDYYTSVRFSEREVCARDFLARYVEACRAAAPLVEFLTKALGLSW